MGKIQKGEVQDIIEALKEVKRTFLGWSDESLRAPFTSRGTKYKDVSKIALLHLGWIEPSDGSVAPKPGRVPANLMFRWTRPGMEITETVALEFVEACRLMEKEKNSRQIINSIEKEKKAPQVEECQISEVQRAVPEFSEVIERIHMTADDLIKKHIYEFSIEQILEELRKRGYHGKLEKVQVIEL